MAARTEKVKRITERLLYTGFVQNLRFAFLAGASKGGIGTISCYNKNIQVEC